MGVMRGAILGALVDVFLWIIGAVCGIFISGLVGLALGILNGLILGAVACQYYLPPGNETRYRTVTCVLSGVVTFLGGAGIVWLIFRPSFSEDDTSCGVGLVPVIVATIAATEAGSRVAKWYINEA